MELGAFLVWGSTTGASWLAYKLMEIVPFLVRLSSRDKRRAAIALSFVIGIGFWALAIACKLKEAPPPTVLGWLIAAFPVGAAAAGLNQLIHGETKLSRVKAKTAK
jgi:hypothetical protein